MRIPILSDLGELFLPTICAGCNAIVPKGALICAECEAEMELCRLPLGAKLLNGLPVVAPFEYAFPVSSLITAAKFKNLPRLLLPLARAMYEALAGADLAGYPQVVVPVPLHPVRRRERGFDQAHYLAGLVAADLDCRFIPDALKRIRATPPQKRADRRQRMAALFGAFGPGPRSELIEGKRVLLVDDVVTTGATLEAALQAVRPCLPAGVLTIVAACTPPPSAARQDDLIAGKGSLDLREEAG